MKPAADHYEDKKNNCFPLLAALGVPAVGAEHASVLIDDGVLSTFWADLADDFGAVRNVFLQSADDAVFPSVDVVFLDVQVLNEFDDVLDGHSVTEDA